jgi:hypothetical protein
MLRVVRAKLELVVEAFVIAGDHDLVERARVLERQAKEIGDQLTGRIPARVKRWARL